MIIEINKPDPPEPQPLEPDKRYLVFVLWPYECSGGMSDMEESFNKLEDAIIYANTKERHTNDVEIYDRIEGREIEWKK